MTHRELLFCTAAVFVCAAAAVWVCGVRYQMRKMMEQMNRMIEEAIAGSFREEVYDESMRSSVEGKLAHYLASSKVSAQNLNREKEKIKELIADISHQTKTPVANILLYSQLLSEKELPEDGRECTEQLKRQAEKLNFLIGSLVKISRLETGVLALCPVKNNVSHLIEEVIAQIAPGAKEKNIALHFKPNDLYACFDRKWTAEAVYNIADNAVKYTPQGGNVAIDLLDTELFVRIAVQDTGIGIPEEETAKIFGRFYRSHTVSDQEGVGIGLFLAREIIAKEGGYIRVMSKTGKGSSFFVYLVKAQSSDR